VHERGAAPAGQLTAQESVSLQITWQDPRHSTAQVVTEVQVMTLPDPARTPQRLTSTQS